MFIKGDRIVNISKGSQNFGKKGIVHWVDNDKGPYQSVEIIYDQGGTGNSSMSGTDDPMKCYEIISNQQKTIMKSLNTMMKKLLDADIQTLLKTEYINGDLELTSKGRDAILAMLFIDKKAELVTLANEEIAEAEKAKA